MLNKLISKIEWNSDIDAIVNKLKRIAIAVKASSNTEKYEEMCDSLIEAGHAYELLQVIIILFETDIISDIVYLDFKAILEAKVKNKISRIAQYDIDIIRYGLFTDNREILEGYLKSKKHKSEYVSTSEGIGEIGYEPIKDLYIYAYRRNPIMILRWMEYGCILYGESNIVELLKENNFYFPCNEMTEKREIIKCLTRLVRLNHLTICRYLIKKCDDESIIGDLELSENEIKELINSTEDNKFSKYSSFRFFRKYYQHKYGNIEGTLKWYTLLENTEIGNSDWVMFIRCVDNIELGNYSIIEVFSESKVLIDEGFIPNGKKNELNDVAIYKLVISGGNVIKYLNVFQNFNRYFDINTRHTNIKVPIDSLNVFIERLRTKYTIEELIEVYMHTYYRCKFFITDFLDVLFCDNTINCSKDKVFSCTKKYELIAKFSYNLSRRQKLNIFGMYDIRLNKKPTKYRFVNYHEINYIDEIQNGKMPFHFTIEGYKDITDTVLIRYVETGTEPQFGDYAEQNNIDVILQERSVKECASCLYNYKGAYVPKEYNFSRQKRIIEMIINDKGLDIESYLDFMYQFNSKTNNVFSYKYYEKMIVPNIDNQTKLEFYKMLLELINTHDNASVILLVYFNTILKTFICFDWLLRQITADPLSNIPLNSFTIYDRVTLLFNERKADKTGERVITCKNAKISSGASFVYNNEVIGHDGTFFAQIERMESGKYIFIENMMSHNNNNHLNPYLPNMMFNSNIKHLRKKTISKDVKSILSNEKVNQYNINMRFYVITMYNAFIELSVEEYIQRLLEIGSCNFFREGEGSDIDCRYYLGEGRVVLLIDRYNNVVEQEDEITCRYLLSNSILKNIIESDGK